MNAILSEKGQVTIPKAIRDDLGLTPGAVLDFQEDHGVIIVRKIVNENPISAWRGRGSLPGRLGVMDYLTATRGE
jgi:AbrB family looped-hinge helix DNA binding protein